MALTHALAINNYGTAHLIVATSAANGTHTTLASAMADAVSGDTIFLRDSVTENVTLTAGVNIAAWTGGSLNTATITGTLTMTTAGTCNISGIRMATNSAAFLAVTGSAASIVNLNNCYLNCTNNTGITFSSSSASAQVNIFNCIGDLGTTGIGIYSHSSLGFLTIYNCKFTNTGASSTASTCSAGSLNIYESILSSPISTSSTGTITCDYSYINSAATNTTACTIGGSGTQNFQWCSFFGGSSSAVSISSTGFLEYCDINSTNTNAITGAGTLNIGIVTFSGSSSTINTSTIVSIVSNAGSLNLNTALTVPNGGTGRATLTNHGVLVGATTGAITQLSVGATNSVLQGSTGADPSFTTTPTVTSITFGSGNALNTYVTNTWTPNLQVNASSTGITYTTQLGEYTQIGNVVHFWVDIVLSSKGAGSGSVTISNFPVNFSANGSNQGISVGVYTGVTDATYTQLGIQGNNSSAAGTFVICSALGSAATVLQASMIGNTTEFKFSGIYFSS